MSLWTEKYKPTKESKKKIMDTYNKKYPEKKACRNISYRVKPQISGNHLHHWSYNIEDANSLIELSIKEHNKIHRYLIYDKETFYYKTLNGFLLDTKKKHLEYIKKF